MVLTITVVGNNQPGSNSTVPGHAVLSPNELAQLMSGQTVTGLLNPDGTITINSNVIPNQQMASMPANIQNGIPPVTSSAGPNYSNQISSSTNGAIESIGNIQPVTENSNAINNNCNAINNNNHSQTTTTNATTTTTTTTTTNQKKTGQKRLSAKQKLAQQQQQQQQKLQQTQQSDNRQPILNAQPDGQVINQQPQIVATVQLPNGQIGQLIAPSGGQFWSPNAINLQQLSMAVAAATGTIPQTMSIPATNQTAMLQHQQHQIESGNNMQSQQQHQQIVSSQQMQQGNQQQQQSSQQLSNTTSQQQQQVMTSVQMNSNQMSQVIGRPGQNQLWSGGPISLSQLSALAQQGVVQLSPVQGIPASGPNSQRVMEMLPQASIQGLINQNGQHVQAIPLAGGGQYIAQDPNDPNKWQLVQSGPTTMGIPTHLQQQQLQSGLQTPTSSINNDSSRTVNSYSPFISQNSNSNANNNSINNNVSNNTTQSNRSNSNNNNSTSDSNNTSNNHNINNSCNGNNTSRNSVLSDSSQSAQPQRKLKRLACTCPNCRDGDNSRSAGSDKKKQHICHFPDCNKVYGKTSHLRAHLRWHSGERPYVCNWSFCGKKFTRSDELQRHRRTHTGEKRFQCSECLKRFMRSDHLSKHLKTHLSTKKGPINQAQQLDHQLMQQQDDDNEHDHINRMNGITNMTPTTDQNNQIKLDEDMIDEKITIRSMSEDSVDQMQLLQQQQQQSENSSMGIKLNVNDSN